MNVLLLQLDGKLPNIALMRLAYHYRLIGANVELRQVRRESCVREEMFDNMDKVFASTLFTKSQPIANRVREMFPYAVIGGTGVNFRTLESIGIETTAQDYGDYPCFDASIGFTQRGCRFKCGFCVVPEKEGGVKEEATIADIWRGDPYPRKLLLLDNDFFGQENWRARIEEIRAGNFKVSFCQGINARVLSEEAAAAIASVNYRDDSFERKRIYTAWDNIGDEAVLFRGLNRLIKYGVKPDHIMVYMLVGYDSPSLADADFARHSRLRDFGCRPYPMPYIRTKEFVGFQRWVVGAYDKRFSWEEWENASYRPEKLGRK